MAGNTDNERDDTTEMTDQPTATYAERIDWVFRYVGALEKRLGPEAIDAAVAEANGEDAHGRMVEVLRYLAQSCNHVCDDPNVSDWESHLHEPSTGGHRYCGPCVAWRVLNGSPFDAS